VVGGGRNSGYVLECGQHNHTVRGPYMAPIKNSPRWLAAHCAKTHATLAGIRRFGVSDVALENQLAEIGAVTGGKLRLL
jgi:uncharacterized phage protein gp47/JayE